MMSVFEPSSVEAAIEGAEVVISTNSLLNSQIAILIMSSNWQNFTEGLSNTQVNFLKALINDVEQIC